MPHEDAAPALDATNAEGASLWARRFKILFAAALVAFVGGALALEIAIVATDVPERLLPPAQSIRFMSEDGTLLREAADADGKRAIFVPREDISPALVAATLAVEDARFYSHKGVDALAALRAAFDNVNAGRIVRGASTITMQLARLIRPHPRTLAGKIEEAIFALAIERKHSKAAIVEAYLNRAPYGAGTRGAFAASERYFGRPHTALSLSQTALLAGLPKAPTKLNPRENAPAAIARRDVVLHRLAVALGENAPLSKLRAAVEARANERLASAIARAKREKLALSHDEQSEPVAMHFTEWLAADWEARAKATGVSPPPTLEGDVVTTLQSDWQRHAERLVAQHIAALQAGGGRDAAAVVVDNRTCSVRVMVGSAGYFRSRAGAVNAAVAPRQPGSTLKPFTYALAWEKGFSPRSIVADIESYYGAPDGEVFRPRNYSKTFHGPVLMGEALGRSLNIPAIRVMGLLEIGALLERLKTLGVTSLTESAEHYGLGLTLGNGEVTLLELVGLYAALARGGVPCTPAGLPKVAAANAAAGEPKLDPEVVQMVRTVLEDERLRQRAFGPNNALMLGLPIAVKTGTSSNWRDTWAIGFTDAITVGVWTGDVEGMPTHGLAGATGAGPLFHQLVKAIARPAHKRFAPYAHATRPALVEVEVCALSGRLPHEHCEHRSTVFVRDQDLPREPCTWHRVVDVDVRNGLRAGRGCPEAFVSPQPFVSLPAAYAEWQQSSVLPAPPVAFSPLCPDRGQIPDAVVVRAPRANETFVIEPGYDRARQTLQLRGEIDPPTPVAEWLVDGKVVAKAKWPYQADWRLKKGVHRVQLRAGGRLSDAVTFEVR